MSETGEYLSKLKNWALYVLAILVASVIYALVNKFVGGTTTPPPPPPMFTQPVPHEESRD